MSPAARAASIAALAALNMILGFVFQWLPVLRLGVGASTDAFLFSAIVPQIVLAIGALGLTAVLTPVLAVADTESFRTSAWTCAHGVFLGAVVVNGLLFVFAHVWVPWVVPGFQAPTQDLAASLVRVQLIATVLTAVLAVTWAACYAREQFLWVETAGVIASAAGLLVLWGTIDRLGVLGAVWALVARSAVQVALLVPALGRFKRPVWRAPQVQQVWRRLLPVAGGSIWYKSDPLVERFFASFAAPGQLSLFHLASQCYAAGNQIVTKALINPVVPALARAAAGSRWTEFSQSSRRRLLEILTLTVAMSIGVALIGEPLGRLILGSRAASTDVSTFAMLMIVLGGVQIGGACGQMSASTFIAYGDTRTPTAVGVAVFTIGVPLKTLLLWQFGIAGLAAATSISTIATAVIHQALLSSRLRRFVHRRPVAEHGRGTISRA
jgi:putative peptidoglycan lipid II flippase